MCPDQQLDRGDQDQQRIERLQSVFQSDRLVHDATPRIRGPGCRVPNFSSGCLTKNRTAKRKQFLGKPASQTAIEIAGGAIPGGRLSHACIKSYEISGHRRGTIPFADSVSRTDIFGAREPSRRIRATRFWSRILGCTLRIVPPESRQDARHIHSPTLAVYKPQDAAGVKRRHVTAEGL